MENRSELIFSILSKVLVWGALFAVIYLLRSFSLLMFLVFIFSYIQANAVARLESKIRNRTARVLLVGISFLAIFLLMMGFLVPQIRDQAIDFANNFWVYAERVDAQLEDLTRRYPGLEEVLPEAPTDQMGPHQGWDFRTSTLNRFLQPLLGLGNKPDKESLTDVFQAARDVGTFLLAISSQFVLSLLFSFLIVRDLPNLQKGARSLQNTKLRYVYDEVADSLVRFGRTVGRAFEAQFVVATVNTVLTAIGIWMIDIRGELAFLSLIVFICGFVPIAGVFISSVPICLLALQSGLPKLFLTIALITAVHAIESYVLNPRIFGTHLRLNPVVVMILMTVSGKLFGVWGLILCLPIATYLFQDAIQLDKGEDEKDILRPELLSEEPDTEAEKSAEPE